MFQSTHPHGVRLYQDFFRDSQWVSIHAPARGATETKLYERPVYEVSIHAPARGATADLNLKHSGTEFQSTHPHGVRHTPLFSPLKYGGFNPRTRTGCDLLNVSAYLMPGCFNPRTRTGCDVFRFIRYSSTPCFNPRTRTGCDIYHLLDAKIKRKFQSTHPHGVRLLGSCKILADLRFQSTHPHGVRLTDLGGKSIFVSFNPRTRTGCDFDY